MPDELSVEIELEANIADVLSKIDAVEAALDAFASKEWNAHLGIDWTTVEDGIAAADAMGEDYASQVFDASAGLTLDTDSFAAINASLAAWAASEEVKIPVEIDPAIIEMLSKARTTAGASAIAEMLGLQVAAKETEEILTEPMLVDVETAQARAALAQVAMDQELLKANRVINLAVDDAEALAAVAETRFALETLPKEIVIDIKGTEEMILQSQLARAGATAAMARSDQVLAGLAGGTAAAAGGGGGGGGGLLAALGFGTAAGRFGLAGFGSLGALAGFGPMEALTTIAGVAGSGLGALAGAGALGATSLGVSAVGMGTDLAGMGQAASDAKAYDAALNNLNQAIAVYGTGSREAVAAQNQLNYTLAGFPKVAQPAIVQLVNSAQQFHQAFNQATGGAEQQGAYILNQLVQVAQGFLPTIGQFALQNTEIIRHSLQSLFTWFQGPGLGIFTQLEQVFQAHLPAAMQAFDNAVELVLKLIGRFSSQTGGLIDYLAKLFTHLNGPGFEHLVGQIQHAIGIFHVWWGLIKNVATAIDELFKHDAGTGTSIIQTLSNMVAEFNKWAKTVAGGDKLHNLFEAHKQEILSLLHLVPTLLSTFGQIDLILAPALMTVVTILAKIADFMVHLPVAGPILAYALAFGILASKLKLITIGQDIYHFFQVLPGLIATATGQIAGLADALMGITDLPLLASLGVIAAALAALAVDAFIVYEAFKHWHDIVGFIRRDWQVILAVITGGVSEIGVLVATHLGQIAGFFERLPGQVRHVWSDIVSGVHGAWSSVANWVHGNVTGPIAAFFEAIPSTVAHVWSDVTSAIHGAWSDIANWVHSTVVSPVISFFTAIPGTIAHVWSDVVSAIHAAWSAVANWVHANVIVPVVNFFTALPGDIVRGMGDIVGTIFHGLLSAPQWILNNVIMPIVNFFKSIPSRIGSLGGDILKSITGGLGSLAKGALSAIGLAEGGYVTQPTLALVGESGPEFVIPEALLRGQFHVNPLPAIAPLAASLGGGIASQPIVLQVTTPIQLNGQTLAQAVTTYQLRAARSTSNALGRFAGGTQNQSATQFNVNAVAR